MLTTSAFAAKHTLVRGLDCAFTIAEAVGASVSSLYTFPREADLARRWHKMLANNIPQRSPSLRRYNAMISHDATRCMVCRRGLRGKQRKFCSRLCKNKAYNGCYDFQKSRGLRRKKQLVKLFGGRCSACGYNRCDAALSFHHQNPSQKRFSLDLRGLSNRTWDSILVEAKKCVLLCLNCHAEVHHL
jgi:hypothetical protein